MLVLFQNDLKSDVLQYGFKKTVVVFMLCLHSVNLFSILHLKVVEFSVYHWMLLKHSTKFYIRDFFFSDC